MHKGLSNAKLGELKKVKFKLIIFFEPPTMSFLLFLGYVEYKPSTP